MFASIPTVTRALLAVNVAVFLVQAFAAVELIAPFALWPVSGAAPPGHVPVFQPWQLVSYSFLHGNGWHLFVNMYGLIMFGSDLERLWGPGRFSKLYFASVVAAAVTQLVFARVAELPPYPTVGASGGIFGLLLAYAVMFPRRTVLLLLPPIPMPAAVFALLYALLELYLGVTGTQEGVAHFAHLGGMLGAAVVLWARRGRGDGRWRTGPNR